MDIILASIKVTKLHVNNDDSNKINSNRIIKKKTRDKKNNGNNDQIYNNNNKDQTYNNRNVIEYNDIKSYDTVIKQQVLITMTV